MRRWRSRVVRDGLQFGHVAARPFAASLAQVAQGGRRERCVRTRDQGPFKWVGTRPIRPDGVPKVTGTAQYGADLTMPGMLVGRILRSPHAHARIRSIDTSKAAALPGVKAVMTCEGLPRAEVRLRRPRARRGEFLAHDAQHHGAREGALRGPCRSPPSPPTSKAIADEALALIEVDYEVLPHVIDVDEAMKPDAPLLFEDMITRGIENPTAPSNISKRNEFKLGDIEAGFAAADEVVEMEFKTAAGASGLYRAARLRRALRCRRPVRAVGVEPGPFRRRALHRDSCST